VIRFQDEVKVIGSVKTSSKDRIDKIFMDKFSTADLRRPIFHTSPSSSTTCRGKRLGRKISSGKRDVPTWPFQGIPIKLNPLDGSTTATFAPICRPTHCSGRISRRSITCSAPIFGRYSTDGPHRVGSRAVGNCSYCRFDSSRRGGMNALKTSVLAVTT